ncbi:Ig-like domain-containing protein [Aquimarina agarilytica]|uniref:Ig-like domain-containing protein n=1 Tax=Aquimarina agarilytica TaxID=1087449 RepID=UPI000287A8A2|nr:Ig-like domain-containing protein [Aquimarina agarilytica]
MKKVRLLVLFGLLTGVSVQSQNDWDGIEVPADAGSKQVWELQEDVSDDFNYTLNPSTARTFFGSREGVDGSSSNAVKNKWYNYYHQNWEGPGLTRWRHENVSVKDGQLQLITKRLETPDLKKFLHNNVDFESQATRLGCISSTKQIQFPVYIETRAKIPNAVTACAGWLLSPDDTQEIDFLEAWGGQYARNVFFGSNISLADRLHFSHHVFIRPPNFEDYQPKDATTWYTGPVGTKTYWHEKFYRFGVYWKSPTYLEFYLDGKLVKVSNSLDNQPGLDGIDPLNITSPDRTAANRTGLNKPMDIIINMEDQDWRAAQGSTPTDEEIKNFPDDHTMKVDWIRVYKPVKALDFVDATSVSIDSENFSLTIGETTTLTATVEPSNASDKKVSWSSDKGFIASVDTDGVITANSEGTAIITATSNDGGLTNTIEVTVIDTAPTTAGDKELVIEAEDFNETGGTYDGFGKFAVNGKAGINFNQKGDWGDYIVNIPATDDFKVTYYIGTPLEASRIEMLVDGVSVSNVAVIASGWNDFVALEVPTRITLTEGEHTIRLQGAGSNADDWEWNLERFVLEGTKVLSVANFAVNPDKNLAIVPNPVKNQFRITNLKSDDFDFTIYDLSGSIVKAGVVNSDTNINTDLLTQGMYFVKLSDTNAEFTLKLIKE